jgi:hypothetical protein
MASRNLDLITSDEIEPVANILSLVRGAQSIASRLISESEQEYQDLRNSDWPAVSESARRFRYLCWLRVHVRAYITQQALVTETLRATTENFWPLGEETESCSSSDEETDIQHTETATAA